VKVTTINIITPLLVVPLGVKAGEGCEDLKSFVAS